MDFEIDVVINIIIAFIAYLGTMRLIPAFSEIFVASNQYGRDLNKKSDKKIPEGLGVISSAVYLMSLVVFMPIAFSGLNIPRCVLVKIFTIFTLYFVLNVTVVLIELI